MPGPFSPRRVVAKVLFVGLILVLAGTVALPPGAAARRAPGAGTRITFSHGMVADVQRLAAEPQILVDHQGNDWLTGPIGTQYATSFLWKSEDHGASFALLRAFPPLQRPNPHGATGDNELVILPPAFGHKVDAVVWSDMIALAGLQNIATFDGGNTFPQEYWNDFASSPGADRQWLAQMPIPGQRAPRIYQFYDDYPIQGLSVIYTDDYGKTWVDGQRNMGSDNPGTIATDPVHHLVWIVWGSGNKVMAASSGADANAFQPKAIATGVGDVANLFVVAATDTAGNVYVVWSNRTGDRATYLTRSTDQGQTWTTVRVSPPGLKATAFPWVVAGDPGRVWVTFYGSHENKDVPDNRGPWSTYATQSLDALDGDPSWRMVTVSEHPNHDNEICLQGIGCTAGQAEDRNMLDDFTAAIDTKGMLHVAYNDTNNQIGQSSDLDAGGAFILTARQLSGPSLYSRVGSVSPRPRAPKVTSHSTSHGKLVVSGRHSLPPGNWARDRGGDARNPRHGQGGPGPNVPSLDLRSAWLSRSKDGSIVANLRIKQLPATPQEASAQAGRTVMYQSFFHVNGKVYFAALEGDGPGIAYAGVPGFIPNQAGVAKIATYRPTPDRTQPASFTWKAGKPGRIAITIPKGVVPLKKGARLDQVTALVQLEQGGGNQQFMDEIDATSGTSWRVGQRRRPDGFVQASVDDPSFGHPINARLVGYPKKRGWSLSLTLSRFGHGTHTLYLRQKVSGFSSRVVSFHFTAG